MTLIQVLLVIGVASTYKCNVQCIYITVRIRFGCDVKIKQTCVLVHWPLPQLWHNSVIIASQLPFQFIKSIINMIIY